MARHKKMSTSAQAAAVRQMVKDGESLSTIKADYPNLDDGIAVVEAENKRPRTRGSGPAERSAFERPEL